MKPFQSRSPGTMKQAADGKTLVICAAGTASTKIWAASGSSVSAMSIPASARSRARRAVRSGRYSASADERT